VWVQVVTVLSLKGGVGKTTVVLGLAGAAVQHGLRTLVVDLDPQANATSALRPTRTRASIAEVFDQPDPAVIRAAIGVSAWGEDLHVLVGSEYNERHNHPAPSSTQLGLLDYALTQLHPGVAPEDLPADGIGGYQLVLVDCPPSLGQLTRSALVAADRALLVADPTIFAVAGVQRAFEAVQDERLRGNARLQPLGVLINRARDRSVEHAFRVAELRDLFGPLVLSGHIPDRPAIQQAQGAGMPIQYWDTPGARDAAMIFDGLLGRILRTRTRPPEPTGPPMFTESTPGIG
jgi:cellulose biosynthesis protein BcsQ